MQSCPAEVGDRAPVEIVERKGIGHPDTICDALAEAASVALGQHYLERFGAVLHHNVDKVLLAAGASRPAFGGGRVLAPFGLYLAGRAVQEFRGVEVPVVDLARAAAQAWLAGHLRYVDLDHHVEVHCLLRPGSADLLDVFQRRQHVGAVVANDTSVGVAHAPRSRLERLVASIERHLNSPLLHERLPHVGEDIKVMAVRHGRRVSLTVACAQVDRFVPDLRAYRANLAALHAEVRQIALHALMGAPIDELDLAVNAGDRDEQVYLTVTGTSAEAGDDGATGRGNRVGGLITPLRPMSLDAAAGKNPVHHTGKLYNVIAHAIAEEVLQQIPHLAAVECALASRIGRRLDDPQLVHVALASEDGEPPQRHHDAVAAIVDKHLRGADSLWLRLPEQCVPLFY